MKNSLLGFFFRCFELDMCQKGKKQGANRRFYRRVVGPELVQEKDKKADLEEKRLLYRL